MTLNDLEKLNDATLFSFGGSTLTLGGLLTGAAIVAVSVVLSKIVGRGLRRLRENSSQKSTAALYLLEKLTTYGLVIFGVISGLTTAGLNLSSLAVFAGAIGIGIGLGLQGVVKEFVSGLFLIFDRMVSVGDYVELQDGVRGAITEIGPRATRLRTNDNVNIIVPNSTFIHETGIDGDAHRNALGHLGEIAGGVVGTMTLNSEPVAGAMRSTWPRRSCPAQRVDGQLDRLADADVFSWFSLKLAVTQIRSGTSAISCVPTATCWPWRTLISPSRPSRGAMMRVLARSICGQVAPGPGRSRPRPPASRG
jgi:hypothetical protein